MVFYINAYDWFWVGSKFDNNPDLLLLNADYLLIDSCISLPDADEFKSNVLNVVDFFSVNKSSYKHNIYTYIYIYIYICYIIP